MNMDSNYLDIDEYLGDPIEWEVQRALKFATPIEEYDYVPSKSNSKKWQLEHGA